MSLNRVSYLESWGQTQVSSHQHQSQHQTGDQGPEVDLESDDGRYHELPEESLSSSFQTTFSYRLNFNPYAGPGWNQPTGEDATDAPTPRCASPANGGMSPRIQYFHGDSNIEIRPDPLEGPEDDYPMQTTGAFEVGRTKRICQVCVAVVYCFLAAGVVFGFAALKPVLVREGVYRNLCSQDELVRKQEVCYQQELRLNLMFTIAAVATNVSALPVGTILDTFGPRVCGNLGSLCLVIGALLFGFAARLPFDAYIPGYLFLSLGGPFIFISSFHLSNTFPARSGLILSLLTGAFDASSALFLGFRLINERTNGSFTTGRFFLIYLIVPLFILAAQALVMPSTSYKTAGELVQQAEACLADEANDHIDDGIPDRSEGERQRNDRRMRRQSVVSKIQDLLADDNTQLLARTALPDPPTNLEVNANTDQIATKKTPPPHATSGVWGALHGRSALQQIRTPWFVLITLFTVLQMLRINYFVATIRQQYTYLLNPALAHHLNTAFDILLPLGGLLSIPFIGHLLDSLPTAHVLALLAATATAIGILGCIPALPAAYANIVLFVLYRPFYYTAVSDYAAKVFGFRTFGKVYGLVICLAGLGNFAQPALDALTFTRFARNPVPVNIVLTAATAVVGTAMVAYVWRKAREMAPAPLRRDGAREAEASVQTQACAEAGGVGFPARAVEYSGVAARDWEREPLLHHAPQHLGRHGEASSYGISSAP
ncbi:putative MFS transporter Fmp42 [Aspergillus clavatus NRRL 1]|uniref:MFS transporter, putative n=1 Tax=Aspergillus clavatus (strain ATCC 1007 / CBS 513.65 / DSM 816 / NCTC 3887 / NRRL 1 / QM 1276 / 107) TaxID=344612 RepID=A1CG75_ASPCL|nr:MFS transporter, putative [Aspergillus clavatus NRRL 1]EAW10955.1 MFS transporter, putative [Aspergillus clavatus NRRL 1]